MFMSVYLRDIPLAQAQAIFRTALEAAGLWRVLGSEDIPLDELAAGRILAEPVWARLSNPHYHASAMDGFAVRAQETEGAMPTAPLILAVGPQAQYVDTGDPLPAWANAVISIENIEPLAETGQVADQARKPAAIRIRSGVTPWSHVRPLGEDIVATELVLPAGKVLRPIDLGALAASGQVTLKVARKPRVAILPTGSELVPVGSPVRPGDIIEFNASVLAAQVNEWGGQAQRFPILADKFEVISQTVRDAACGNDLILLNAGSSAGSEDFSAQVIEGLGRLLVHGVAVRPGHPVILGMLDCVDGKPVPIIGVPGYPVSAALTGEIFVEPLLACWQGRPALQRPTLSATLTRKVNSSPGDDDYLRVAVGKVGDKVLAAPLARGAGMITSLVHADGVVIIPHGTQGLSAGTAVTVHLYRSAAEIENTIFAIGSHDLTLDVLAQYLAHHDRRLASVNAGSLGGLVALQRGEAHLAGSHLLDPATGEYNLSYIRQYCPGLPVAVFGWVGRKQGLLVRKGNPKQIVSLQDLARPDVTFVNRQRGAGTRVLLDYHLAQLGISVESVQGYQQEEYTHLAVAAAVSSGRVECGLGVAAAAAALDLDFIPLFDEHYELVIPRPYLDSSLLAPLFELAHDPDFRQTILSLPGYDITQMGLHVANVG
jgi:putative molybdopterin biosynthesis protein